MLYLDCFSGASGDMLLGAFLDLGLPLEELRRALGSLAIDGAEVSAERVDRAGITATKLRVRTPDAHGHRHHHLPAIEAAIRRSALSAAGKDRAVDLFQRLAAAEAAIHQTPIERVHLHEVGALDSIIDIVGTVFAFEWFGIDDVVASPLNVGSGTVECAHGTYPVPAPAAARLLEGVPVYAGRVAMEMVTPTGALLVTGYAREYGAMPPMTIERIGYGAGDRDVPKSPNVLRILKGARAADSDGHRVAVLECEIDDMNPQLFGPLMDALLAAGALDVFYAPVQMKKGRPGTLVTVIAPPPKREALTDILFRESTTIGVRHQELARTCLDRTTETVETEFGPIRFKVATRHGEVLNAAPEFDDCARAAAEHHTSIKIVQAAAIRARRDRC